MWPGLGPEAALGRVPHAHVTQATLSHTGSFLPTGRCSVVSALSTLVLDFLILIFIVWIWIIHFL